MLHGMILGVVLELCCVAAVQVPVRSPTRHPVPCLMTSDEPPAANLRKAVKQGLLGALGAADSLLGLSTWKAEKEEERVLDLIAEAESIRIAAAEAKARRSLPQENDDSQRTGCLLYTSPSPRDS